MWAAKEGKVRNISNDDFSDLVHQSPEMEFVGVASGQVFRFMAVAAACRSRNSLVFQFAVPNGQEEPRPGDEGIIDYFRRVTEWKVREAGRHFVDQIKGPKPQYFSFIAFDTAKLRKVGQTREIITKPDSVSEAVRQLSALNNLYHYLGHGVRRTVLFADGSPAGESDFQTSFHLIKVGIPMGEDLRQKVCMEVPGALDILDGRHAHLFEVAYQMENDVLVPLHIQDPEKYEFGRNGPRMASLRLINPYGESLSQGFALMTGQKALDRVFGLRTGV